MIGTALVLMGAAGNAAASPSVQPLSLQWRAPVGCPVSGEVEAEVTAALAHLRGRGAVQVDGEVTTRAGEPGYVLHVRVTHAGQVGERALPLDDCLDAARASALLVALSVENLPQAPRIEEEPAPKPNPPRSAPASFSLGLGPHLAWGVAPEPSAGIGLSLSYSRAFLRLSARGAAFAEAHHAIAGSQLGGSFQLMTAGAFACGGYPGKLAAYACMGSRVDRLEGIGTGTQRDARASTLIGSVAAGITLEWKLTRRFLLRSEIEAGYPLGEARFVIVNEAEPVHEVKGWRGEAALELGFSF